MRWEFVVVLVIAIPVILFPAVLIWYLNAIGIFRAIQKTWKRQADRGKTASIVTEVKKNVATTIAKEEPIQKASAGNQH